MTQLLDAYTRKELAQQLHRSTQTLANWTTQGVGPKQTVVMGRVYYLKSDVQAWLDAEMNPAA